MEAGESDTMDDPGGAYAYFCVETQRCAANVILITPELHVLGIV